MGIDTLRTLTVARRDLPSPAVRRAIREDAGASLQELADALEVHKTTAYKWEVGLRTPRGAKLAAYVEALRVLSGT